MKKLKPSVFSCKRGAAVLMALLLVFVLCASLLTGCSAKEKLYLFNFGNYLDPEVLSLFEEEYGIRVVCDEYAAPEDMYARFTSGTVHYDLICTSDYMLEKLIQEKRLSPINKENIPNLANINQKQWEATEAFDPGCTYTIPHFWGTLGILYDTTAVSAEEVKSWDVLFDGSHAGNIIMPNSERDAFFVALTKLGYSTNTTDPAQLQEAADLLRAQKKDVQAYLLDQEARGRLEAGNADLAVVYSGEVYLAAEVNPDVAFAIPQEGTCLWLDSFAIPAEGVLNRDYAEKFLDFLCRPEIAQMNFEYIYYSTPNKALMDILPEDVRSNKALFPEEGDLTKFEVFRYLGPDTEKLYSDLWKYIKS